MSLRFAHLSSPAPQCRMPHAASMHSVAHRCTCVLGFRASARMCSHLLAYSRILSLALASCSHTLASCSLCVLLSTLASYSLCVHAYSRVLLRSQTTLQTTLLADMLGYSTRFYVRLHSCTHLTKLNHTHTRMDACVWVTYFYDMLESVLRHYDTTTLKLYFRRMLTHAWQRGREGGRERDELMEHSTEVKRARGTTSSHI